jgi:hypothetical protein
MPLVSTTAYRIFFTQKLLVNVKNTYVCRWSVSRSSELHIHIPLFLSEPYAQYTLYRMYVTGRTLLTLFKGSCPRHMNRGIATTEQQQAQLDNHLDVRLRMALVEPKRSTTLSNR